MKCSLFSNSFVRLSAFLILYEFIRVAKIRTPLIKTSWAKQITLVRDNVYRVLKSSKNSKSFENLLKQLGVICHYFSSTDNSILSSIEIFFWNATQST